MPSSASVPAEWHSASDLNRECRCASLDRPALHRLFSRQPGLQANGLRLLLEDRPHLFADEAVFLSESAHRQQLATIAAIARLVGHPAYQARVLAYAPQTALAPAACHGAFVSYDFHVDGGDTRLIEINTNAGGGFLNALMLGAHRDCSCAACRMLPAYAPARHGLQPILQAFQRMFMAEWQAARGGRALRSVAIVDDHPQGQFLYPEFQLFQGWFASQGMSAVICDPQELSLTGQGLLWEGQPIDLVYNRLTDFGLEEPAHRCLREAYLSGAAVVTPHPRAHALYADKRNLAVMTDPASLQAIGVESADQRLLLANIAHTFPVRQDDSQALWTDRKRLFFKPVAGFGGKAAYRGDKLTRRVFETIVQGQYVAQAFSPPGGRLKAVEGGLADYKFDVRYFAYRQEIQLLSARLYQGQTTNFRTMGGGFAPVRIVSDTPPAT